MATAVLAALGTERILDGSTVAALLRRLGHRRRRRRAPRERRRSFTALGRSIAARLRRSTSSTRAIGVEPAATSSSAPGAASSSSRVAAGLAIAAQQQRITRIGARLGAAPPSSPLDLWSVERLYWLFSPRGERPLRQRPGDRVAPEGRSRDACSCCRSEERPDWSAAIRTTVATASWCTGSASSWATTATRSGATSRSPVGRDAGELQQHAQSGVLAAREHPLPLHERATLGEQRSAARSCSVPCGTRPVRPSTCIDCRATIRRRGSPRRWRRRATRRPRATVLDPRFDPLRVAVIDSDARRSRSLRSRRSPSRCAITANVTRYDPGHIAVELSAPAPAGSALVVSENYFPGLDGDRRRPARRSRRSGPTTPSSACRCRRAPRRCCSTSRIPRTRREAGDHPGASSSRCWPRRRAPSPSGVDVSSEPARERALVIVPTYNERENIRRIIDHRPQAGRPDRGADRRRRLAGRDGADRRRARGGRPARPSARAREEDGTRHRLHRRLPLGARARLPVHPGDGRGLLARSRRISRSFSVRSRTPTSSSAPGTSRAG